MSRVLRPGVRKGMDRRPLVKGPVNRHHLRRVEIDMRRRERSLQEAVDELDDDEDDEEAGWPPPREGELYAISATTIYLIDTSDGLVIDSHAPSLNDDLNNRCVALAPGGDAVYVATDSEVLALDTDGWAELWKRDGDWSWIAAVAVGGDGQVYVGHTAGVAALDPADGSTLWDEEMPNEQSVDALAADDVAVYGLARDVAAFNPTDGTVAWHRTDPTGAGNVNAIGADWDGGVYVINSQVDKVMRLDRDNGQTQWDETVEGTLWDVYALPGLVAVATGGNERVVALDADDGSELWAEDTADNALAVAFDPAGEYAYVGTTEPTVEQYAASDGAAGWTNSTVGDTIRGLAY